MRFIEILTKLKDTLTPEQKLLLPQQNASEKKEIGSNGTTITDLPADVLYTIELMLDVKDLRAWKSTSKIINAIDDSKAHKSLDVAIDNEFKTRIQNEFGNVHWKQCYKMLLESGVTNPCAKDLYLFLVENIRKPLDELNNKKNIKKLTKHQRFYSGYFNRENILTAATRLGCHIVVNEVINLYENNQAETIYLNAAMKTAVENNNAALLVKYLEVYQEKNPLTIDLQLHDCFEWAVVDANDKSIISELIKFKKQHRIPDVPDKKTAQEYVFIYNHDGIKTCLLNGIDALIEKEEKTAEDRVLLHLFDAINENNLVKVSDLLAIPSLDIKKLTYLNGALTPLQLAVVLNKPDIVKCFIQLGDLEKPEWFKKFKKSKRVVTPLLNIDLKQQNCFGQTALDLAKTLSHQECVQLLQPSYEVSSKFPEATLEFADIIQFLKFEHSRDWFIKILRDINKLDANQNLEELLDLLIEDYLRFACDDNFFLEDINDDEKKLLKFCDIDIHDFSRQFVLEKIVALACKNEINCDWLSKLFGKISNKDMIEILNIAIDAQNVLVARALLEKIKLIELSDVDLEKLLRKFIQSHNRELCKLILERQELYSWIRKHLGSKFMPKIKDVDFIAFLNIWHKKIRGFKCGYAVGISSHVSAIKLAAKNDDVDELQKLFAWFSGFYRFYPDEPWVHQFIHDIIDVKAKRIVLFLLKDKRFYSDDVFRIMLARAIQSSDNEMFYFIMKNSIFSFKELRKMILFQGLFCSAWENLLRSTLLNKKIDAFKAMLNFVTDDIVDLIGQHPWHSKLLADLYREDAAYLDVFLTHWPVMAEPILISNNQMKLFMQSDNYEHLIVILKHFVFTDQPKIINHLYRNPNILIQAIFTKAMSSHNSKLMIEFLFEKLDHEQRIKFINEINPQSQATLLEKAIDANNFFAVRLLLKHGTQLSVKHLKYYLRKVEKEPLDINHEKILHALVGAAKKQLKSNPALKNYLVILESFYLVTTNESESKIQQSLPTVESQLLILARLTVRSPQHMEVLINCLPKEIKSSILPELRRYCADQFHRAVLNKQFSYAQTLLRNDNPLRYAIFDHYAAPNSALSFLFERMCEDQDSRSDYETLIKKMLPVTTLNYDQFLHFNKMLERETSIAFTNCVHVAFAILKLFLLDHSVFLVALNPFMVSINNDLLVKINTLLAQARTLSIESRMNTIFQVMQQDYPYLFPSNLSREYTTVAYYYNYKLAKTNGTESNIDKMLEFINSPNFDPLLLKIIDNSKAQECFAESIVFLVMQEEPLKVNAAVKKYFVNHKEALVVAFDDYVAASSAKKAQEKLELHRKFYDNGIIKSIIDEHRHVGFFKETTATRDIIQEQQTIWETLARQTEARNNFSSRMIGPR